MPLEIKQQPVCQVIALREIQLLRIEWVVPAKILKHDPLACLHQKRPAKAKNITIITSYQLLGPAWFGLTVIIKERHDGRRCQLDA